jgi:cytoskeletal protein RodZ
MTDIGRMLREERLARGLEISEIARRTCISIRFLHAIEEGRFQTIPSVYDKGYLKIYAKALDMDAARILALYNEALYNSNQKPIALSGH